MKFGAQRYRNCLFDFFVQANKPSFLATNLGISTRNSPLFYYKTILVMTKFFFSIALLLLTLNLMTSCGNTESPAEETATEEAQEAVSNTQNALTKSTEVVTYQSAAAITQAIEGMQSQIQSKITSLKADLNGANAEAANLINKKINLLQENLDELNQYKEKSTKIDEVDVPGFGKSVAALIEKIKSVMAALDKEK